MINYADNFFDHLSLYPRPRSALFGLDIIESKDVPRYVLPEEVIPGVPWPKGFREEFNSWSIKFLGTTNMLPRGVTYILNNNKIIMRPEDIVRISNLG